MNLEQNIPEPTKAPLQEASYASIMDAFLPSEFRTFIEDNFYRKVGEQATLENIKNDPDFHKNPTKHIALYTDHSVVHVRDVALQVIEVIEKVNGVLIPKRDKRDLDILQAYSLQLVYLHDIGMSDFSPSGRFMHPEFAAQFVFSPAFDPILELLWERNAGNLPWTLWSLFKEERSEERVKRIYREMLSLSIAHSKSKVPIDIVNDPVLLRERMLYVLSKPLKLLFLEQKIKRLSPAQGDKEDKDKKKRDSFEARLADYHKQEKPEHNTEVFRHYEDYKQDAFFWLETETKSYQKLIVQVQDALRCIRSADALRQRGTVLRTSAGYEIFVDRKTANAIYALRNASNDQLYLLEAKKSVNSGEANLASSEMDASGNLRVSFHVGAFARQKTTNKAAQNAAMTIDDIQADTVQSFRRDPNLDEDVFAPPSVSFADIKILVEATDDNPNFALLVCKAFEKLNPKECYRIQESFSLHGLDLMEVRRYLSGEPLSHQLEIESFRQEFLKNLSQKGYSFAPEQEIPGQEDIRVIHLPSGEQLIRGGGSSGFVYFPLSDGLRVYPLGGYESRPALPWVPLGNTGVIRGAIRNAHVFAEKPLELICVPKDTYLKHWYRPISAKDLIDRWRKTEEEN